MDNLIHAILATLILIGTFPLTTQEQSGPEETISQELRQKNVESFDYVWTTVRDSYWDPKLGGVDWEALKIKLRPQIETAKTVDEARGIIRTLLDSLEVSHFAVIPAEAYEQLDEDKPRGGYTTGIDVRIVDDQVLVTDVRGGSPASDLGVKMGWQIIRIGDTDVSKRYQEISEELADHPHLRTILVDAAQGRLLAKPGESVEITFLDGENQEIELTIPVVEPRGKLARFGHIPDFHVWIEAKKLEGNKIGYIAFNAFMDPAYLMPQINLAMADFKDYDGIIFDVRGNGGGLGEMGTAIMGWLLPDGRQQMGTVILRDTQLKMFVHPRAEPYLGKVVVLIDEMSISAAEFFASGMNDLKLARLIGTRTAGAVLGSSIERLPNGDGFQYARANYVSKSTGKTLEGIGVPPHEEVFHQRDALLKGRDLQLESAIKWINENK